MAFWNRSTNDSSESDELEQYYPAEKSGNKWMAWLLAGTTLLITVAIGFALFVGGRLLYRAIIGSPDEAIVTEQPNGEVSESPLNTAPSEPQENDANRPAGSAASRQAENNDTSTPRQRSSTPGAGPSSDEIPNTGPSSPEL